MASRSRRNQPGTRPEFPWYSFPRDVAPAVHARWTAKLELLRKRRVHVPAVVDWYWVGQSGLMDVVESYFDKLFNGVDGQFMCLGWRQIFEIQEVVYTESIHGFFYKKGWDICR
ncbi:unnamed protein product [Lactuca virosa]|uniref:Uncharacterized protein n=1 Tax=Lactuca virosa TaxID=75947 RepID=A0AAU9MPU4_9ASTR|nr:unnamed protein product [Lactuca virosa]